MYNLSVEETLKRLDTKEDGLSASQVMERQAINGYNELVSIKRKNIIQVFALQFRELLVIILIAAALLSVLTGNAESSIVILCVITINAVLGTVQHFKAEQSLDSLKSMSAPFARIIRDGSVSEIPAREICVGDIMLLEAGNIAAADGRIIESVSLMANESSLTGESEPVQKSTEIPGIRSVSTESEKKRVSANKPQKDIPLGDRINMIYSGSQITAGRGCIAVTAIGMNTEIGRIAAFINETERERTPLQKSLDNFSKWLSIAILVICAVVMSLSMLRGETLVNALMFAVALAVAAIPEALSSIVTISLAIGTQKMAKENAIIKDLKAVEGLGCVSIICSDKTGTLTQNKMTVRDTYTSGHEKWLKRAMLLCNDSICGSEGIIGDPTETALVNYCGAGMCEQMRSMYPRISEVPFDSDRKLMSTLHRIDNVPIMITKGAVDVLLPRLKRMYVDDEIREINQQDINRFISLNKRYSENGMRILCFAQKEYSKEHDTAWKNDSDDITGSITGNEKNDHDINIGIEDEYDYTFIGLAAMTDPPRPESSKAVSDCIMAGIKPIMITGDHKITAAAIAKEIGILGKGDMALSGNELDAIDDDDLTKLLPHVAVYARVSPAHKIRIVSLWQKLGNIVAMTGDGVNDAPALKKADVGVAMGITGTQVSKDAASMILTDDNFATIIKSVSNGRNIYRNIKNAIMFLISGNTAGILAVLYTVLMGLSMPFTAVHLLFINLLTDSLPAIAISMEKADEDVMKQKPRSLNEGILTKQMVSGMLFQGVLLAFVTMSAYYKGLQYTGNSEQTASTMAFAALCLGRLFGGFNYRSERPLVSIGLTSNGFSILAFLVGVVLLFTALFATPFYAFMDVCRLDSIGYIFILILALTPTVIIQLWKMLRCSRIFRS